MCVLRVMCVHMRISYVCLCECVCVCACMHARARVVCVCSSVVQHLSSTFMLNII